MQGVFLYLVFVVHTFLLDINRLLSYDYSIIIITIKIFCTMIPNNFGKFVEFVRIVPFSYYLSLINNQITP